MVGVVGFEPTTLNPQSSGSTTALHPDPHRLPARAPRGKPLPLVLSPPLPRAGAHMSSGTLKKDAPRSAAPADEPPLTLVNEAKGEQKAAF